MTSNNLWNNPEEINNFRKTVDQFLNQKLDAERFMAFRLQHGVYGQRQDGVHMIRVKIPGGRLFAHQLPVLSDILANYCETPFANVTTRQDIQFHFVKLEHTPDVLERLSRVDLTTREACGNTVRNITSCALSGVCPQQVTDINPYTEAVAQHFLRHPLTQHLPRKFKMSFSACATDCAMGLIHDVGIVANHTDNTPGFRLLAGGGLGHKPRQAITVVEKLQPEELIPAIEAIIALHNRYSDRKRRAKARIKFLIERFGQDGIIEKFNEEFQRSKLALSTIPAINTSWREAASSNYSFTDGAPRTIIPQQQDNLSLIPLQLKLGQISSQQLTSLYDITQTHGIHELRATSDQNLVLINVPNTELNEVCEKLTQADLHQPKKSDNIVACPGTWTCRLGITSSQSIAQEINNTADLRVRVSGCHNSCGQHHVADIGLHGEGKRIQGKLIPSYVIHLGGNGTADGKIAIKGPTVPTLHTQEAVERISNAYLSEASGKTFSDWVRAKDESHFETLLKDLVEIAPENIKDLARDIGENESFRVLQLGGGECAGATQDLVASNFSEALHERNYCSAFFLQHKHNEAIECAKQTIQLTASSVLFLAGNKTEGDLTNIEKAFFNVLGHQSELIALLSSLCQQIEQLEKQFDAEQFHVFATQLDDWIKLAANACQEMDEQLDLIASQASDTTAEEIVEIDLSTYECPLHYVKARNELRKLPSEQLVRLILEDDEAVRQVSSSLKKEGHDIQESEPAGEHMALTVRRKK